MMPVKGNPYRPQGPSCREDANYTQWYVQRDNSIKTIWFSQKMLKALCLKLASL